MRLAGVLVFAAAAAGATAQEAEIARYGPILDACYRGTVHSEARRACKGALAAACMEGEEGGQSTLGMSICNRAEAQVWDKYLNREYRAARVWARAMDDEERALFPEFATRADALLAAQRAWIAFRDAECGLEYAVWGAGSMRHIAGTGCILEMTAERTLELSALREGFE